MSTVVEGLSRGQRVHDELQRALLAGEISVDARLTEPKVSAYFGVSRSPVREALGRLVAAGLLRRCDYGFAPVRPTLAGVRDLYELRLAIELAGVRRVADNADVAYDRSMLEGERDRWLALALDTPAQEPDFVLEDEKFHVTVLAAAGNGELVAALEAVNLRIRRVRMHDFMVNNRIDITVSEHLAILGELLSGDLAAGSIALRAHIGDSLDVVVDRVEAAIVAMARADQSVTSSEIGRALQ